MEQESPMSEREIREVAGGEDAKEKDARASAENRAEMETRLTYLGLTLENLRNKTILDLGSGPSLVERAARDIGITGVISADSRMNRMSDRPEMEGRLVARAQNLPIQDTSIDLVISLGGPPGITNVSKVPERTFQTMNELERILKPTGEARLFPTKLSFLDPMVEEEIKKHPGLSVQEKDYASSKIATGLLRAHGYNIELIPTGLVHGPNALPGSYWKLKPRSAQELEHNNDATPTDQPN